MAEIKIEKKRPVWPWIIAAILIFGVIYFVLIREDQVRDEDTMEIESVSSTDSIAE